MNLSLVWKKILSEEFEKPYFIELIDFVETVYRSGQKRVYPEEKYVFRALDLCSPEQVKVIIIGQDPYPTYGHANGLCFSVSEHVKPFPRSLQHIFMELHNDTCKPFPENGSLLHWATQGVLLINSILTVEEGKPDSHAGKGWEQFTDAIIRVLSEEKKGLVYMLWGSKARKKALHINASNHLVLHAAHPSPLSAYRGFFGCSHFSKTNEYLEQQGLTPIKW